MEDRNSFLYNFELGEQHQEHHVTGSTSSTPTGTATPCPTGGSTVDHLASSGIASNYFSFPSEQPHLPNFTSLPAPQPMQPARRTPIAHTPLAGDFSLSEAYTQAAEVLYASAKRFGYSHPPMTLKLEFPETKKTKIPKSPDFTYSPLLEKLFCKVVAPVTFKLRTSRSVPFGSRLLAAVWANGRVVQRCPNHKDDEEHAKKVIHFDNDRTQFIVAKNSQYVPVEQAMKDMNDRGPLQQGNYISLPIADSTSCDLSAELYFMCFSSCLKGVRNELKLEFKIEHNGKELCHTTVPIRSCACPGRDRGSLEDKHNLSKEEEGQGGSPAPAFQEAASVGKRPHSDVEDEEDGQEVVQRYVMIEGTQAVVRQCLNGLVDNARLLGAGVADLQPTWRTVKTPKTEGIESEKSVLSPLARKPPRKKSFTNN